jgi:hypothetical protein
MKLSSVILMVTFLMIVTALFASNVILKKEYDKVDKSDLYWTYGTILEQPFRHLKIEGGNITNIAFEQSKKPSVRVSKNWYGYEEKLVKTAVRNDTLFIKFPNTYRDQYEKEWLKRITPVRIFSPELLSVDGRNTNFELFKLKQKSIAINLSGRSKLEVESYLPDFDTLRISQRDSSEVVFEMSPDLMTAVPTAVPAGASTGPQIKAGILNDPGTTTASTLVRKGWETMTVRHAEANLQDISLLDLGHAQITSLKYNITDSAAIILSGGTLKKFKNKHPDF